MFQEIGGILVDAIGTGSLEFFLAIAAREKSDAQSALSQEKVPRAYQGAVKDYFDDLKK